MAELINYLFTHSGVLVQTPTLAFGAALDAGPVWDMQWCPLGGYSSSASRLGVLALACASGDVHLLSIPKSFLITDDRRSENAQAACDNIKR